MADFTKKSNSSLTSRVLPTYQRDLFGLVVENKHFIVCIYSFFNLFIRHLYGMADVDKSASSGEYLQLPCLSLCINFTKATNGKKICYVVCAWVYLLAEKGIGIFMHRYRKISYINAGDKNTSIHNHMRNIFTQTYLFSKSSSMFSREDTARDL